MKEKIDNNSISLTKYINFSPQESKGNENRILKRRKSCSSINEEFQTSSKIFPYEMKVMEKHLIHDDFHKEEAIDRQVEQELHVTHLSFKEIKKIEFISLIVFFILLIISVIVSILTVINLYQIRLADTYSSIMFFSGIIDLFFFAFDNLVAFFLWYFMKHFDNSWFNVFTKYFSISLIVNFVFLVVFLIYFFINFEVQFLSKQQTKGASNENIVSITASTFIWMIVKIFGFLTLLFIVQKADKNISKMFEVPTKTIQTSK